MLYGEDWAITEQVQKECSRSKYSRNIRRKRRSNQNLKERYCFHGTSRKGGK
jgi:hypothetical protein